MKLALASLLLASTVMAAPVKLKPDQFTVISVTVTTPLPTGLESAPEAKADADKLYAAIVKHPNVEPYIKATEVLHKEKLKDAGLFAAHAQVEVDCEKHPAPFGSEDKNFCAITTRKSYGWYADLSLILEITGFIHKDLVK